MVALRFFVIGLSLTIAARAAIAQSPYPQASPSGGYGPLVPQTDADRLAGQMRVVAANPSDLYALVNAAQLSLKVGDSDGAAALYARAERIDPRNAQVKAGQARLLVQAERPGEALRVFQEAQALGASERDFGPDRALAYDLIGEQQRAQRDYRAQLRLGQDDETVRRYALSLGISGLKEPALALLEPLNRRSDRGAWRVRAFVLAMNGERAAAEQIATTMMPPGMAQGLAPFFDRLPRLAPIDRAFAVHFGQVRSSPTRIADARRTPALPALSPEPNPFPAKRVQVAVVEEQRRGRRNRRRDRAPVTAPVVAAVVPLPAPPAPTARQLASLTLGGAPFSPNAPGGARIGTVERGVTVLRAPADAYVPRADTAPISTAPGFTASRVAALAEGPDEPVAAVTKTVVTPSPAAPFIVPVAAPSVITLPPAADSPAATVAAAVTPPPTAPSVGPVATVEVVAAAVTSAPAPAATEFAPAAAIAAAGPTALASLDPVNLSPPAITASPAAASPVSQEVGTPPAPTGLSGDAVLAAIVAAIEVPATELAPKPTALPPAGASGVAAIGKAKLLTAVEQRADTKAIAREKAEAKAKRAAKDKPDPLKLEPARNWVQVAGGANEASLAKEWARLVTKAPVAFKGKQGWTTPLRATNRVLAGPFPSDSEARAFVNLLGKSGIAAFTFTSEAGQKVVRLGTR